MNPARNGAMQLILWRHAEAHDGSPDDARELTPKGRKQAARMAGWLRGRLPEGTRILVSPAVRAQQTAAALDLPYDTVPAIGTAACATDLIDAAGWPQAGGCVLIVGHQPTLGAVAARLIAGLERSWSVKKGAVWWLVRDLDAREGVALRAVLGPEALG